MFHVVNLDVGNHDESMIALVLQSAPKKDFAIAKVRESAAGGQMMRLSKEFESVESMMPGICSHCRYLALLDGKTESKSKIRNERLLFSLRRDRFGNALSDTTRHILNLLNYVLSDTESFVLSHGFNFGLPPKYLCKEIFANLSHCGHSFYITVQVLLNNALL